MVLSIALVEDQDARVGQEGAGDGNPLPLPAGESYAPLANLGIVSRRETGNELVGLGLAGTALDLLPAGLRLPPPAGPAAARGRGEVWPPRAGAGAGSRRPSGTLASQPQHLGVETRVQAKALLLQRI